MNYPTCRQIVASGYYCGSGSASSEFSAFLQEAWPGGAMDGAVHSSSAQKAVVSRIDYGVDLLARDVAFNDFNFFI